MPTAALPELTREDWLAMLASPESPAELEWKISPTGIVDAEDDTGVVTAIVAVTGIVDEVNDIIVPGAFRRTLAQRIPKGVWSHDIHTWVSRTDGIGELMPGDARLPSQWKGKPWPKDAGALVVRTAFNLGSTEGKNAFSNVVFFDAGPLGPQVEWSIGYNSIPGLNKRDRKGIRHLEDVDLYEYGPVLFGAMPLAGTIGTKARVYALEHKGALVSESTIVGNLGNLERKVAGKEASPKDVKNTEKLKQYWEHGAGAAKIRWGEPGDFMRCVKELGKYLPPQQVKGYCANRHKGATGGWPGHAPGVESAEAAAKKEAKGAPDPEESAAALLDGLEGKAAGTVEATDEEAARAAFAELGMSEDEIEAALADTGEFTELPEDLTPEEPVEGGHTAGEALGITGEHKASRTVSALTVGDQVLELKHASGIAVGQVKAMSTRGDLVGLKIGDEQQTVWVAGDAACSVAFDPYVELKSGLALVAEGKDYPYLPGSVEERQCELREAVRDLLLPEPDDQGNVRAYVNLDATFADYVVATLNDYSMPGPDDEQSFVIPYAVGADGAVELGQPAPVEKQVVLVPGGDADDQGTDKPTGGMNPSLALARKVYDGAKALLDTLEAKAADGVEDLSGTHVRRLRAADEAIDGALTGLGLVGPGEGKSAELGEVADLLARAALLDA